MDSVITFKTHDEPKLMFTNHELWRSEKEKENISTNSIEKAMKNSRNDSEAAVFLLCV